MSFRRSAIALALVVMLPPVAAAQREPAPPAGPAPAPRGWTVTRDPFANLWFHAMALVGDQGFGVLPLYDAARARATPRRAPRDAAADERLRRIRRQLAADSALELLHFVPMYFVGIPTGSALDALDDAAASRNATATDRAHVVARMIAGSLPAAAERRTLAEAVAVARDEQSARLARTYDAIEQRAEELELRWNETFLPLVGPYLAGSGQRSGVIVVVPTIGFDGRVVAIPSLGTVVAVATRTDAEPDAPLLAAVRELAFRALDHVPVPREGRVAAARRRDVLAVRAGAILLERNRQLLGEYRGWYHAASPFPFLAFEQIYPVDPATERALRAALAASGLAQR